jgi:tripartite-type tricarboxylate transporter receptor subunit TctC
MDARQLPVARRSRRTTAVVLGFAAALTVTLAGAPAAAADDFYAGKTITVIVGFAPGGGVDTTARVVARHLVRHIPGQPGMVVQNMEAAAGLVAATHMSRRVVPDGLTLAVPGRSWFIEGIVKSPGVTFDPTRFSYIGSPGAVNSVMYVRSSTGVTSFDALKASPRTLIFGALRSNTPTAMVPAMLARRGAPIRPVPSYGSTARVLIALRQGEVDGFFTVEDSFAHQEDMIDTRVVVPILQTKPKLAGVPLVRDVLPASDGPLLRLVLALEDFGLPLVGPPGLPPERLALVREAFLAMSRDPDYQAEAIRMNLPVGAPVSGAELAAMIDELAAGAAPDVVAAYRRLSEGE